MTTWFVLYLLDGKFCTRQLCGIEGWSVEASSDQRIEVQGFSELVYLALVSLLCASCYVVRIQFSTQSSKKILLSKCHSYLAGIPLMTIGPRPFSSFVPSYAPTRSFVHLFQVWRTLGLNSSALRQVQSINIFTHFSIIDVIVSESTDTTAHNRNVTCRYDLFFEWLLKSINLIRESCALLLDTFFDYF